MQSPLENNSNGIDGRHPAISGDYDLLLLDVMLLDVDGWQIVQSLRATEQAAPVLFLIVRNSAAGRVKNLEMGADDYSMKPPAFAELLVRVRTLLRRGTGTASSNRVQVAGLVLDLARRRASRGGQKTPLASKKSSLLGLLVRRRGEVLPRSLIASQVWDMNFNSGANVIDVAIRRLHVKIDDHFEPRLIQTVRGMGYILEAPRDAA